MPQLGPVPCNLAAMVAAALSAAVTSTKPIGEQPHSQAEPTKKKDVLSNASRSSGGGPGEGLLSEKPPPPEFFSPLPRIYFTVTLLPVEVLTTSICCGMRSRSSGR